MTSMCLYRQFHGVQCYQRANVGRLDGEHGGACEAPAVMTVWHMQRAVQEVPYAGRLRADMAVFVSTRALAVRRRHPPSLYWALSSCSLHTWDDT